MLENCRLKGILDDFTTGPNDENRSDFLIRLLRYYGDLGFEGCICIVDSSNAVQRRVNQKGDGSVPTQAQYHLPARPSSPYHDDFRPIYRTVTTPQPDLDEK